MNNRYYFSYLHPALTVSYFTAELAITMFVQNPLILGVSLIGAVLFYCEIREKKGFGEFTFIIAVALLIIVSNPIFSHNGITILFYIGDYAFTLESVLYGVNSAAAVSAVILWCRCFNIIVTDDKSEYLFGRVFPKTSLILTMALRFIPLYKRRLKDINDAQKGIGVNFEGSFITKIKTAGDVFLQLVTWSLENSVDTGISMKARGYGENKRTSCASYKFKAADLIFTTLLVLLFSAVIFGLYLKKISFSFYPTVSGLTFDFVAVTAYASFFIMSFLPCVCEGAEKIKWKYYLSKT